LYRAVAGALGFEEAYETGVAALVRELHRIQDLARLFEHVVLDVGEQRARRFVLAPCVARVVADFGLQRANARLDLRALRLRAFDLALVAVEDRQRRAEEEPERVAPALQPLLTLV
jgi:hypothetical protein